MEERDRDNRDRGLGERNRENIERGLGERDRERERGRDEREKQKSLYILQAWIITNHGDIVH